ncbi:chitotriosidase-1-like [Amblyomma americanum]
MHRHAQACTGRQRHAQQAQVGTNLLGPFLGAAARSKTTPLAELRSRRQADTTALEGALFPGPQGALDAFTDAAKGFLSANSFVGLSVNLYNPDSGPSGAAQNYLPLLKALKTALEAFKYQLVATVYFVHGLSYGLDFAEIAKTVDILVLGTHYLVPDEKKTTLPSPLYGRNPSDLSWESVIDTVLDATKSPDRVVVSMSFSGSEFVVRKEASEGNLHKQGLPAAGHSQGGPHTRMKGILSYFEICLMFRTEPWKHAVNTDGVCPIVGKDTYWVGYDNSWSIRQKIAYVMRRRLAGIAIQRMEMDDWNGVCGEKMPLYRTVAREMQYCRVK